MRVRAGCSRTPRAPRPPASAASRLRLQTAQVGPGSRLDSALENGAFAWPCYRFPLLLAGEHRDLQRGCG